MSDDPVSFDPVSLRYLREDVKSLDDLMETVVETLEAASKAHGRLLRRIAYCESEIKMLHQVINDIDEEKGEIEDELTELRALAEGTKPVDNDETKH